MTVKKKLPFPLIIVSLFSPDNRYDTRFLGNYATINIIDALKRVPGVGDVVLFGSSDYAMRIWVKPDTLTRLNITIGEIQQRGPGAERGQPRRADRRASRRPVARSSPTRCARRAG